MADDRPYRPFVLTQTSAGWPGRDSHTVDGGAQGSRLVGDGFRVHADHKSFLSRVGTNSCQDVDSDLGKYARHRTGSAAADAATRFRPATLPAVIDRPSVTSSLNAITRTSPVRAVEVPCAHPLRHWYFSRKAKSS